MAHLPWLMGGLRGRSPASAPGLAAEEGAIIVRKLALASMLATALWLPSTGLALGLGEIELRSALNQRLDARIPLRGVPDGQANDVSVELASEQAFQDVGLQRPYTLTKLRFLVRQNDQANYHVRVRSTDPITEPFLTFLVKVEWPGGNLLREYTVLLDPPTFASQEGAGSTQTERTQAADPGDEAEAGVPGEIERSAEAGGQQEQKQKEAQAEQKQQKAQQTGQTGAAPAGTGDDTPVFLQVEREQEADERVRKQREQAADDAAAAERQAARQGGTSTGGQTRASAQDEYGPVQKGEALWNIAKRLKSGDVTIQQMMVALLRYNPEAFAGDNVNRLRQGYVLRVPEMDEVRQISMQKAVAQVSEQNAMWKEWRRAQTGGGTRKAAETRTAEKTASKQGQSGTASGGEGEGQLEIVGSEEGGASSDEEASATSAGDESPSEKLKLAKEELESVRMEKKELASRVAELEKTVKKMEKLITLREEKLSKLQQQLEKLRQQKGGEGSQDTKVADADTGDKAATSGDGESGEAGDASKVADTTDESGAGQSETSDQGDSDGGDGGGETQTAEADTDDVAAAESGSGSGSGDSGSGSGSGSDTGSGSGEASAENGSGGDGETSSGETDTASAEDTGGGDETAAADGGGDQQAAGGVETTRTETPQQGWLDTLIGIGTAAIGVVLGLFTGGLTSPGVLGLGALVIVALLGAVVVRRRRAQAESEDEGEAPVFTETGTETEATETLAMETAAQEESETHADTASAEAAESALMEESFDLSAIEGEGGEETTASVGEEEEVAEDDTIAEANVYLAYGLHQQAEDVLRLALKETPDRSDYQEKLLETLYSAGKRDAFVADAKSYQGMVDTGSSRGWQRVVAMGREIAPDDQLFSSAEAPDVQPEELQPAKPESADLELDAEGGEPALDFALDEGESTPEGGSEQGAEDAFSETLMLDTGDFDAGGETAQAGSGGAAEAAESESGGDEFELDLGDIDELGGGEQTESESAAESASGGDEFELDLGDLDVEGADGEGSSAGSEGESFDFDLEGLGDDTSESGSAEAGATEASSSGGGDEFDLSDLDLGEEESATGGGEATAGAEPAAGGKEATGQVVEGPSEGEFDLDALGELEGAPEGEAGDLDAEFLGGGEEPASETAASGGQEEEPALDFDIPGLDTAGESRGETASGGAEPTPSAASSDGAGAADAEVSSEEEEIDTMLDLAKAYIDMGDAESASNALQEVIESGNDTQKGEAEKLLETVQ